MNRRSSLLIIFGVAFFLVGAAVVFIVLSDDDESQPTAAPGERMVTVVVPTADIAAGTEGDSVLESPGAVELEQLPQSQVPGGAITSLLSLRNRSFGVAVGAGTPITTQMLIAESLSESLEIPQGYEALAVEVGFTAGVAQYVSPGDRINLYSVINSAECRDASGTSTECPYPTPRTELLLTNVLVLDVSDETASFRDQQVATTETTVVSRTRAVGRSPLVFLLALNTADAEKVILHAAQVTGGGSSQELYASLVRDDAPLTGDTPGTEFTQVFAGVPNPANAAPVTTTTTTTVPSEEG